MKYIRTKDGRIIDTTEMRWCECSKQASYYKDKNYMLYVPIKEADTIEELCDRYLVYVSSTNDLFVYKRLSLAKEAIKDLPLGTYIYGAIIVFGSNNEPIIKTVTKPLNDNEEFELL